MLPGRVLLIIILSSFTTPFLSSAINIALPQIGQEFELNGIELNWIASIFLLFTAIFLLPAGKLADVYSKLLIFKVGLILVALASLGCALAPGFFFLLAARIVQAIGGAALFSTSVSLLVSIFPQNIRGRLLGLNTAAVYAGLSLGPVLGGLITEKLGWRGIFYAVALIAIFVFVLSHYSLKDEKIPVQKVKIDLFGLLLYALGLIIFMVGLSVVPALFSWILIALGITLLIVFFLNAKRTKEPLLNVTLFAENVVFRYSSIAALIHYSATFAVGFLLSIYFQVFKGLSPRQAGLLLLVQPFVQSLLSPFSGRLSDRISAGQVSSAGMAISAGGLVLLFFLNSTSSLFFASMVLILLGIGFAFFSSPNTNAIMSAVSKSNYGQAAATVAVMRMLGQMSSMGIVLFIFALNIGAVKITNAVHSRFFVCWKQIFFLFFLLCLFGIRASLKRSFHHEAK